MIGLLLWIAGCYAVAAACAYRLLRHRRRPVAKRHYVIVAGNHEEQIEWVIRSLRYQGSLSGMDVGITVLLEPEAADSTASIVEKLVRMEAGVSLIRQLPESGEDGTAVRMRWEQAKSAYAEAWNGPNTVWMELPRSGEGNGFGPGPGLGVDQGRQELTSISDRLQ